MLKNFWCLLLTMGLINGGLQLEAGTISEIIAFGDSLNDTGNVYLATGGTLPPSPPYATGRFSNGPIWLDQFAAGRGLASPLPYLAGGNNFSVGGAQSGTGSTPEGVPNLLTQVGGYLAGLGGGPADPNALYVLWAGGNDFLNGETNPQVPASNLGLAVSALAGAGATNFLVMNLAPLGDVPESIANLNAMERAGLNQLVLESNQYLKETMDSLASLYGITIQQPDVNALYQQIQADPLAYGFTNITTGALQDGNLAGTGYLFWDELHPTSYAQGLIASAALATVPEPSTMVMTGLAMACMAAFSRRQRHLAA